MNYRTHLDAVVVTTTGTAEQMFVPAGDTAWAAGRIPSTLWQVIGTYVGTVIIEGSIDNSNWFTIQTITADTEDLAEVIAAPWMRATFTRTSGTVTVLIAVI